MINLSFTGSWPFWRLFDTEGIWLRVEQHLVQIDCKEVGCY